MQDLSGSNNLFSTFPSASMEDWIKTATAETGGKNPLEALKWQLGELTGDPYYDKNSISNFSNQNSSHLTPSGNPFMGPRGWFNLPIINSLDERTANSKAHQHLNNGADGILFDLRENSSISLETLLHNIEWSACFVSFYLPSIADYFFNSLQTYLETGKIESSGLQGFFLQETYPQHPQSLHNVIHTVKGTQNLYLLGIRSQLENPVDQISDTLLRSVVLIEQKKQSGIDINKILSQVFFSVTISTDIFIEIAKLKALRFLWYQIVNAYGITDYSPSDLFIHAHSTRWKQDSFQPHENMLKGTTASLAAILGGCNGLTTDADHGDDERITRIARNVSNVLREESHLSKVADPTAGSYYIESLVSSIASQAWKKFTETVSK